jgi:MFS family permease
MDELEDTLRLPARDRLLVGQKKPASGNNTSGLRLALSAKDWDVENDDFDTMPMSKVSWPVMDEFEDTVRRPVVPRASAVEHALVVQQAATAAGWINADGQRIILARALRMFGYGFASVLIGVTLATAGFTAIQVSLLLSTALAGDVVAIILVALLADRLGRRRILVVFALLMAIAGLAFAFSHNLFILLFAAFFGTISPSSTSENAPFTAIEQAILPQTCLPQRYTDAFARYNLVAQLAGAIGGLAVALPDIADQLMGIATNDGVHIMFALYGLVGLAVAVLFMGMSKKVESAAQARPAPVTERRVLQKQSRPIILRLASFFAIDAFAGGLAVQAILAYWFRQRFGISLSELGILFFGTNLLAALSLPVAARLAKRFGLLRTMVFTHLPSQIFLVLVPLMPTFWLAAFFLLCRQSLSKMDVPTRQAYIMRLVVPEERTAAASFTTMARSVATSMSPLVAGVLLTDSLLVLGLPFLLAGGLSAFYDLLLYGTFRNVPISN